MPLFHLDLKKIDGTYDFFSIWVFIYEHLQITGEQRKGGTVCLTPLYRLKLLQRYLEINQAITSESYLPLK